MKTIFVWKISDFVEKMRFYVKNKRFFWLKISDYV